MMQWVRDLVAGDEEPALRSWRKGSPCDAENEHPGTLLPPAPGR